jgi:hypothetical protein
MEGDQGRLQARPLHICCHILHAGVEVIVFTLTCEFNSLLYAGVEAGDDGHTCQRDLSNQGPTPLGVGRLVG